MFSKPKKASNIQPCPFCERKPELRMLLGRLVISCETKDCVQPSTWLTCSTVNLIEIVDHWNQSRRSPTPQNLFENEINKYQNDIVYISPPSWPDSKGEPIEFFAKDSKGQWYYVNHARTWQTCPPPFPRED